MNPGVLQHNNDADDQHGIAHDLSNRVLEGPIESGVLEESLEQQTFGSRRQIKYQNQQSNQHEDLDEAEVDTGQTLTPRQWNSGGIYRADREEDKYDQAQHRGRDSDQIGLD